MSARTHLSAVLRPGVTLRRVEEGIWSVLPPSQQVQRYDAIAARYDRLIGSRLYQRLVWGNRLADDAAFAREAVDSEVDGAILDAGCGSLLTTTDAHLAGERPTVLLDLSIGMLRRAKARIIAKAGSLPERIVLLQSDVLHLPFRPGCFRTVLCPGILHVFADPGALVRSLDAVLEPDGALFVSCLVTDRRVGRAWLRLLARGDDVQSLLTAEAVGRLVEAASGRDTACRATGNVARLRAGGAPRPPLIVSQPDRPTEAHVSASPPDTSAKSLEAEGPNAQQIEFWNAAAGPRWVAASDLLDAQIGPIGLLAIDRAAPAEGDRVLDVGCGTGQTSAQLGERVGPSGSVLGIDISTVMLARAQERAREAGLARVTFENADAQTHAFASGQRDLLFSRFGVMFFADPQAAFANLRTALRPEGRVTFLSWQEVGRNPWMLETIGALAKHVPLPAPPEPGAPGPFSFADPARVTGILEGAGFANVAHESLEPSMLLGGGGPIERAIEFMLGLGPASAVLRDVPEKRDAVAASLREVLERYVTPEGVVMEGAAWIVTARNPG